MAQTNIHEFPFISRKNVSQLLFISLSDADNKFVVSYFNAGFPKATRRFLAAGAHASPGNRKSPADHVCIL